MARITLQEQYAKRGIGYVYNQRNRKTYLNILNAPYFDPTYTGEGCKLTGHLIADSKIETIKNIDFWVSKVRHDFELSYRGNVEMLKYAENIS